MNKNEIENKLKEVYSLDFANFLIEFFKDKADITIEGNNITISAKDLTEGQKI